MSNNNAQVEITKISGPVAKATRKACEADFKAAQVKYDDRVAEIQQLPDSTTSKSDRKDLIKAAADVRAKAKLAASVKLVATLGLSSVGDVVAALATSVEAAYKANDTGTVEFTKVWSNVLAPWIGQEGSKGDKAVKALAGGLWQAIGAREVLARNGRMDGLVFCVAENGFVGDKSLK